VIEVKKYLQNKYNYFSHFCIFIKGIQKKGVQN